MLRLSLDAAECNAPCLFAQGCASLVPRGRRLDFQKRDEVVSPGVGQEAPSDLRV
jgi:hypothetical protein